MSFFPFQIMIHLINSVPTHPLFIPAVYIGEMQWVPAPLKPGGRTRHFFPWMNWIFHGFSEYKTNQNFTSSSTKLCWQRLPRVCTQGGRQENSSGHLVLLPKLSFSLGFTLPGATESTSEQLSCSLIFAFKKTLSLFQPFLNLYIKFVSFLNVSFLYFFFFSLSWQSCLEKGLGGRVDTEHLFKLEMLSWPGKTKFPWFPSFLHETLTSPIWWFFPSCSIMNLYGQLTGWVWKPPHWGWVSGHIQSQNSAQIVKFASKRKSRVFSFWWICWGGCRARNQHQTLSAP